MSSGFVLQKPQATKFSALLCINRKRRKRSQAPEDDSVAWRLFLNPKS